MYIEHVIARGQVVPIVFGQVDVAANQTDVQLPIAQLTANINVGTSAPWNGEIVGIGWDLTAAATAGQLTIGATVNGTEDADTTQTVTTAAKGYARFARGKVPFVAGDQLGVEITTNAGWNAITSDLSVVIYALYHLDGI